MPKDNHLQAMGLTFGLPNNANKGIDIKVGSVEVIIDSNGLVVKGGEIKSE